MQYNWRPFTELHTGTSVAGSNDFILPNIKQGVIRKYTLVSAANENADPTAASIRVQRAGSGCYIVLADAVVPDQPIKFNGELYLIDTDILICSLGRTTAGDKYTVFVCGIETYNIDLPVQHH